MFDIFLILIIIAAALAGLVIFCYGLIGLGVKGFDKSVRNSSLGVGFVLLLLGGLIYWYAFAAENSGMEEFVGKYESTDERKLQLELKEDGTFLADEGLFIKQSGKWKWISADEFHYIEILADDGFRLRSLEITYNGDQLLLKTDNAVTVVEYQMELRKLSDSNTK